MSPPIAWPPQPPPRNPGELVWPLDRVVRWRRDGLGDGRPARAAVKTRHHAGVDLAAAFGDTVYAMHDGRVIGWFDWPSRGSTAAALLVSDAKTTTLYGAVEPESWETFGIGRGSRVVAGEPIATVGKYPGGSSMLHLSLHTPNDRDPQRWYHLRPPPPDLFDVRPYLEAAEAAERGEVVTPPPKLPPVVEPPVVARPTEPPARPLPAVYTPPPPPPPPGSPATMENAGGLLVLAILAAVAADDGGWLS